MIGNSRLNRRRTKKSEKSNTLEIIVFFFYNEFNFGSKEGFTKEV